MDCLLSKNNNKEISICVRKDRFTSKSEQKVIVPRMSQLVPLVCSGATLRCPFGSMTSKLNVTPKGVDDQGNPAATIMDFVPLVNIKPFGMCRSLANPQVASATAAASGALTPMPCIPVTSPWQPGSTDISIANQIVLHKTSTCQCMWAGIIKIVDPGQFRVDVANSGGGGSGGGSGGSTSQQKSKQEKSEKQEEEEKKKKDDRSAEDENKQEQDKKSSEGEGPSNEEPTGNDPMAKQTC